MSDASATLIADRVLRKQNARDAIKAMVRLAIENQEPYIIGNISIVAAPKECLFVAAVFDALAEAGFPLVSHSHSIQEVMQTPDGGLVPKLHISFVCRAVDGKPKTVLLS